LSLTGNYIGDTKADEISHRDGGSVKLE